ncbi:transposase [Lentzea sp. NPDC004782]|uniref:transposase n=1 Tax=Lentzea sp. NPDC004782 TaxID=3154458 RepID=UPI0033A72216
MIDQVPAQIDMLDARLAAYVVKIEQAMRPFARAEELLMTIPGISDRTDCDVIGSIGTDMTIFPTPCHLASWAGVCPATTAPPTTSCPRPPPTEIPTCGAGSGSPREHHRPDPQPSQLLEELLPPAAQTPCPPTHRHTDRAGLRRLQLIPDHTT